MEETIQLLMRHNQELLALFKEQLDRVTDLCEKQQKFIEKLVEERKK